MLHTLKSSRKRTPSFREPTSEDGPAIWELIQECKPLDENSMYCNLIQCDHFRDTCVVAELDGKIVGWVSAYLLPDDDEALFVWQVAVSKDARGMGMGGRMLQDLIGRDICKSVTRLQTTITRDNEASWALFRSFADRQGGELEAEAHFMRNTHFQGQQATEHMVTIKMPERMKKAA
jgi:L-2,4-diaminobutyric acid acetyltransferase